jgi:hypothetical protein
MAGMIDGSCALSDLFYLSKSGRRSRFRRVVVSETDKTTASEACSHGIMNPPEHRTTGPSDLESLVNVGPAVARRLERIGITRTSQLAGRDPVALFELMCAADGHSQDPCLLDTLMSAIEQADGGPARPWWHYSEKRKRLYHPRPGASARRSRHALVVEKG